MDGVTLSATIIFALYCLSASAQTCVNAPGRIVCDGVSSIEELTKQLSAFELTPNAIVEGTVFFTKLENMPCLPPPTMFRNLSIRHLELSGFELPFWNSPVYNGSKDGFKNVNELFLTEMGCIQNWNWKDIDRYIGRNISVFHIVYSRFVHLPSQLKVIYGDHVDLIRLIGNKIRWLDDNSLNCVHCTQIFLQDNEIEELKKDAFGLGLKSLGQLYLSSNKIRSLPKDLFENFGSISGENNGEFILELSYNPLERLEEETFAPLIKNPSLKKISIYVDNRYDTFKCQCDLKWLTDPKFNIQNLKCTSPGGTNILLQYFLQAACTLSRNPTQI